MATSTGNAVNGTNVRGLYVNSVRRDNMFCCRRNFILMIINWFTNKSYIYWRQLKRHCDNAFWWVVMGDKRSLTYPFFLMQQSVSCTELKVKGLRNRNITSNHELFAVWTIQPLCVQSNYIYSFTFRHVPLYTLKFTCGAQMFQTSMSCIYIYIYSSSSFLNTHTHTNHLNHMKTAKQ